MKAVTGLYAELQLWQMDLLKGHYELHTMQASRQCPQNTLSIHTKASYGGGGGEAIKKRNLNLDCYIPILK